MLISVIELCVPVIYESRYVNLFWYCVILCLIIQCIFYYIVCRKGYFSFSFFSKLHAIAYILLKKVDLDKMCIF